MVSMILQNDNFQDLDFKVESCTVKGSEMLSDMILEFCSTSDCDKEPNHRQWKIALKLHDDQLS